MNKKFIGAGAAGNKAVIDLINTGIIPRASALLVNSTLKDIATDYHDISHRIGDNRGGCGKEKSLGRQMAYDWIGGQGGDILDSFIDPNDDTVIIINATEGGTGCGSAPVIAAYYKQVHELDVHIITFTGFHDDARGLQNTVEYFQDMKEEFIIQAISNMKFLEEAGGNKLKAEKLANQELINRVRVLTGQVIVDSDQNIDETDLYKVTSTPGFMTVESALLNRSVKDTADFNRVLESMVHNTKSLDVLDSGVKRIAMILNASARLTENIDLSFNKIKEKLGTPYEIFTHIQYDEDQPEAVYMIASGMRMPKDEITDVYNKYLKSAQAVNTSRDSFFDSLKQVAVGNAEFDSAKGPNTMNSNLAAKAKFLAANNISDTPEQQSKNSKEVLVKREDFIKSF